ncbi:hypothetical protein [Actinophytocola sp.]|uniref:hypothetical protein n=1 Tax=Actinophytocola sp. TaxID=1872138 RepID=UPI002ED1EBE0
MRTVGAVLAAAVCLLLSGSPATAQPPDPQQLIDQLSQNRVVRLPGAVTTVDVARVPDDERVLLAPQSGLPPGLVALLKWAGDTGVALTVVEGLWIERYEGTESERPLATADERVLRQVLAYGDVTGVVLGEQASPATVPATDAQLDQLTVSQPRDGVRLARVPMGPVYVDYAGRLAARFPGELVVVAHGAWLEFAGPGADRAEHARNAAYGPVLLNRGRSTDVVTAVLDRMTEPPARPVYDLPRPEKVDLAGSAIVVTLVAAAATVVAMLLVLYLRWALRRRETREGLREARARAYLSIEELGTRLAEDQADVPAAAERYATARALFDQALTPEAMAAVREVAEEGLVVAGDREEDR